MSAAKHTAGPWFAREWNTRDKTTVMVDAPGSFLTVRQIAECEEEADARLIAEAPALYEAAREFVKWAEQSGHRAQPGSPVAKAREAIARIHGEQK